MDLDVRDSDTRSEIYTRFDGWKALRISLPLPLPKRDCIKWKSTNPRALISLI